MPTTLKIKNSSVAGKVPDSSDLVAAELAINLADRRIYSKDVNGTVFEIGGGASVPGGDTPPSSGNQPGDLFFDSVNNTLLYWDGTAWVPIAGDEAIALDNLSDVSVDGATEGQILAYDGSGEWIAVDPPKLEAGGGEPNNPELGDIWVDTSDCPPTLNIWDDCSDPGNPTWTPIGGGGSGGGLSQTAVEIVSNNGTELFSTLTAVGGNGTDKNGNPVSASYEWTGAKTNFGKTIVADVEGEYTVTATVTADGQTRNDSASITIVDTYVPMTNTTPPVISVIGGGPVYPGSGIAVTTNATVAGGSLPQIVENRWYKDNVLDGTETIYSLQDDDIDSDITCKQLFRDVRNNELLSELSNTLTVIALPLDVINFTVSVYDNGNNFVGNILTADADNLSGGVAPEEKYYQWYQDGIATSIAKYRTIQESDVGKVITCDVTCAEPDGSNPVTKTGTYGSIPEAGTNPPVVNSVALVETGDGAARFEGQSFAATINMVEGDPISTKSYEYKVEGTLSVQPTTSEIVGEDKVTVPGGWTVGEVVEANNWRSVTYGINKYVAVASSGGATTNNVMVSSNGIGWSTGSLPNYDWVSVAAGTSKYVAVAMNGTNRVATSSNGTDWSDVVAPSLVYSEVAYGGGTFVLMAPNQITYSTDEGDTWTQIAVDGNWKGVTYGNSRFMAVAQDGYVASSPDGINWTQLVGATSNRWEAIAYGNGKFVAISDDGPTNYVMWSADDGVSWTIALPSEVNRWRSVTYGDGKFVAVAKSGTNQVMWSTDGISWTSASAAEAYQWMFVTYGDDKFVAVAQSGTNRVMWSEYGNDEYESQELTLADNTGLDDFTPGMLVKQNEAIPGTAPAFSTTLYTGNGGNLTTPPTGIDLESKALVWIKNRDTATTYHVLVDNVRPGYKTLCSNDSGAEAPFQDVLGFNSDTTVDITKVSGWINHSGNSEVMWSFRAAPKFFDIQTYLGTGGINGTSDTLTVSHNLTTTPGLIICKGTDSGSDWSVYHKDLNGGVSPEDYYLSLNHSDGESNAVANWGGTAPTSTEFTVGANANGAINYVAYLFADDTPNLIKCGSYTGGFNKQIDCGFKPQWVMIKRSNGGSDWSILDQYRYQDPSGGKFNLVLKAQESDSERTDLTNDRWILPNTNGFQLSSSNWADTNSSSGEYIFIAIAEDAMADASVTPAGLFQSYDDTTDPAAPTMTLTPQVDGWQANQDKKAVGPETVLDNATLYLETNNLRQVTGTSAAPVAYETVETSDEITFDLPTGTGQTWDEEFPVDSTITACVVADNTAGGGGRSPATGTICSNVVQPEILDEDIVSGLFATTLWTGDGNEKPIRNGIDNTNGSLFWAKRRGEVKDHRLYSEIYSGRVLHSNKTAAADPTSEVVTSFDDKGVTLSSQGNDLNVNYVGWNFKAAPKFFDVQTWTGTGSDDGQIISHDLTSEPACVIGKRTNGIGGWYVYHKDIGFADRLVLNESSAVSSGGVVTAVSNTELTVYAELENNTDTYVGYLFADQPGLIKCGSYIGSGGSYDEVSCGFKPQWLLSKPADATGNTAKEDWHIIDDKRGVPHYVQTTGETLFPNSSAEGLNDASCTFTDDGFIPNGGNEFGKPGIQYIYVAIAAPPVPPINDLFATTLYTGNGTGPKITNGIDLSSEGGLVWIKNRDVGSGNTANHYLFDTDRGVGKFLNSNTTTQQDTSTNSLESFDSDGFTLGASSRTNNAGDDYASWSFRKAPKFFDVQTYTGNSTVREIPHDLTSVPGFLITKPVSASGAWYCWHKELGIDEYIILNNTPGAKADIPAIWNNTLPTNTHFSIGSNGIVNTNSTDYIAYLFADEAGLIKCGKTGTLAVNEVVDCGFEPQFILAKQYTPHNTVSNWIIVDNKRTAALHPDNADKESPSNTVKVEYVENGFKVTDRPGRLSDCIFVAIAAPVVKSMTQDQVDNTKLLFQTKPYRQEKYAQDLLARGADLRASLEAQGYNTAEIDEVLGE